MAKFTPILFEADDTERSSFGLGRLTEAVSCTVTETLNADEYELVMEYPIGGRLASELIVDRQIVAKPSEYDHPQPFRIYYTNKDMSTGLITVNATHVCLNLIHSMVSIPGNITGTISEIWAAVTAGKLTGETSWPFTFESDLTTEATIDFRIPKTLFEILFEDKEGILDKFGGHITYDGYKIKLLKCRGANRGVSIRESKNLSTLTAVVDATEVITGIVPYYAVKDSEGNLTRVLAEPPVVSYALDNTDLCHEHLVPIDCTSNIEKPVWATEGWAPSSEEVREWGQLYLAANYDGYVPVTYAAGVVEDPETINGEIHIGDTVLQLSRTFGLRLSAMVSGTVYDCIKDCFESISIGNVRSNLAGTLVDMTNQKHEIDKVTTSIRTGSSGAWSWTVNSAGTFVDVSINKPVTAVSCNFYSGGYYRSNNITISAPTEMEYFASWSVEGRDYRLNSDSDGAYDVVFVSQSSSAVVVYLRATKRTTVTGKIYFHYRAHDPEMEDTYYTRKVDWHDASTSRYVYTDCNRTAYVGVYAYYNKTYTCLGKCDVGQAQSPYILVIPYGSYYFAGFVSTDGGASPDSYETGADWVYSQPVQLYTSNAYRTKVGSAIPANTHCRCLACVDGSFLIVWQPAGTDYHRVGWTRISGGLLEEDETT